MLCPLQSLPLGGIKGLCVCVSVRICVCVCGCGGDLCVCVGVSWVLCVRLVCVCGLLSGAQRPSVQGGGMWPVGRDPSAAGSCAARPAPSTTACRRCLCAGAPGHDAGTV